MAPAVCATGRATCSRGSIANVRDASEPAELNSPETEKAAAKAARKQAKDDKRAAKAEYRTGAKPYAVMDGQRPAMIWVGPRGVELAGGFGGLGTQIPWDQISEVVVDGAEAVQKRVTATRLVAVGIFAFAFKKADGEAYIAIETVDGAAHIYSASKKGAAEVRQWFAPYKSKWVGNARVQTAAGEAPTPEQRLQKLADLRALDVITEDEYQRQRDEIINQI